MACSQCKRDATLWRMRNDKKPKLKRFGGNVRRLRMALGLTQEKLAEMSELHPRVVQKIEAGQTNILVTTG